MKLLSPEFLQNSSPCSSINVTQELKDKYFRDFLQLTEQVWKKWTMFGQLMEKRCADKVDVIKSL